MMKIGSFILVILLFSSSSFARDLNSEEIQLLKTNYSKIQSIMDQKCAECHTDNKDFKLPPEALKIAEKRRAKAMKKFNLNEGFPFVNSKNLLTSVKDIHTDVEENDMPPRRYLEIRPEVKLTEIEKKAIYEWVALVKK